MKIINYSLLSILLVASSAFPDSFKAFECVDSAKMSEDKLKSVVHATQENYSKLRTLKANFLQTSYLSALDISDLSSGQMYFEKPGKMRWEYEEPEKQLFITRSGVLWFFQPEPEWYQGHYRGV